MNRTVALHLAEHGIAIFPCRSDNKRPLINDWDGNSTTDLQVIAGWWSTWPDALPAIDLRKAGLIALDGDRHGGPDGVAALRTLIRRHRIDMRGVPIAHTAGGGVHLYWSNPDQLGNREGSLPPGINVRGAGGYVITPGARLPDRRIYRPAGADLMTAVKNGTVPSLPQAMAKIIKTPRYTAPEPQVSGPPCIDRRARAYAEAALIGATSDLASMAPETGRNIALNGIAFRLGRMVARGWIDKGRVVEKLRDAATACGLAKEDGPRSVDLTIASGLRAGMGNPHPGPRP